MADDLTPAPSEPVQTAPAEPASASPPASESSAQDTRAIAASVFADSEPAQVASPAADPSAPAPPPAAAISDDEADADYQNLLASGSMPVDRHRAVLTNARNKTRAEVEREFQAKYGWVDERKLDRARTDQALGLMEALDKNPEHTLRTIAQALGVSFAPPPAATEPQGPPAPDVKLEDGRQFYEAERLNQLLAWKDAQYDQKLAALESRYKPLVEERHLAKMAAISRETATVTLTECRTSWPSFPALEGDILARMQASPDLSLERAYIQAFAAKGLPALQQQYATDRASQLTRKAAASSAPPGAARPVTPQGYASMSTRDIAASVFAS